MSNCPDAIRNPATLAQAKKRWNSHTKHVLSSIGRACAKTHAVWCVQPDGTPVMTIGEHAAFRFAFWRDENGNVWSEQLD